MRAPPAGIPDPEAGARLWRGSLAQRLRLVSGLVLFVFAGTHFANHALGLVGLDTMMDVARWRVAVTRSIPGSLVLGFALLAHVAFSLVRLAERRTLRMPPWEAAQTLLGFAIPFLLVPHVLGTRIASLVDGTRTNYPYVIVRIWPDGMGLQTALLLVVWLHGCLGLHAWLRLSPLYRRMAPVLAVPAVGLPAAALAGIVTQGRLMERDTVLARRFDAPDLAARWQVPPLDSTVAAWGDTVTGAIYAAVAVALGIVLLRAAATLRARRFSITYVGGPTVRSLEGPTLLEISRANRVPHVSVCGGRGRCSTCRVLVVGGEGHLSPPGAQESAALRAIGAPANVRLACQAKPGGDVAVVRILDPRRESVNQHLTNTDVAGIEREVAILFIDIRGFTTLSERKLPFDVVFILNRFFEAAGREIEAAGGWIGGYAGDGLLALFTHPDGIAPACRSAFAAAGAVDRAVTDLNRQLAAELPTALRMAMGLHAGPLVLGRLGYGASRGRSVIGPAVNLASRLESLAKAADVQIVASSEAATRAGIGLDGLRVETVAVRGVAAPLPVIYAARAGDLAGRLGSRASA
ncbi:MULTISPECIES: adenylate/guanylate cyclase domain-containing protein [Methylobacterium]|jgi:adenylate cyclase|uniref:adenylate/guanylate cyclase domain-containing protein n=1 Tax=Methylobacterium TaxID=407 RepID=UPI0008E6B72F|nr:MULTISPECIES: adenylate/guanylate cyclase domain-containing protein [Methylobacterium]MBZ6412072.1 adenylate/guanylate cyclase domain-containing protein [Methylobacterium sp.]MBK3395847.1 adenylate/guanylate cyclase domain-containing protein [Methylobacterium ajmalii]MBK3411417.1 adenylate/guanylate cyclase domain-containing protein [Methylobacterium ajmalii]MBK3421954.1 adenylate/guanylate cyclase domain-containing protein [Methylobacterium ajmalii]SFF13081.1 adenylate cyclase [Methylobact